MSIASTESRPKILIIENERVIALDLKMRLERLGCRVTAITDSGAEAVRLASEQRPDLVLADILLPGELDGITIAEILRDRFEIPVVFVTAHCEPELLERAKGVHPYGYILKPFNDRELAVAVDMALHIWRLDERQRVSEQALRAQEERYRVLVENAREGIAVIREGRVLYANPFIEEITGYRLEDLKRREFVNYLHQEDREWALEIHLARMRGEDRPTNVIVRLIGKAGETRWFKVTGVRITWEGRPATLNFLMDVTDLIQAEEVLKESEERFRTLAGAAFEAILLSKDFICIDANPAAESMFGHSRDQLIGKSVLELMAPESRELAAARMREGYAGQPYAALVNRRGGDLLPVEIQCRNMSFRGETVRVVVFRDLSESRRAEEHVRAAADIVRAIPSGLFILRYQAPDGLRLLEGNPAGERLIGFPVAAWIGREFEEMWPQTREKGLIQAFLQAAKTGIQFEAEKAEFREGPVNGMFRILAFPLPGGRLCVLFEDITARQRAEAEMRRLESQLRQAQKMEAVGTLAGGIAHDFNNILGAILGYAQLSLLSIPPEDPVREYVERVEAACGRARDMVSQILSFSRKTDLEPKPLEAAAIIKEAVKFLRSSLPSTIAIRTDVTATNSTIIADPSQIHQLIMNLGANAAYAMRERGGSLDVGLTEIVLTENDVPPVSTLTPGRYLHLTVSDSGEGMSPETLERIFEPYFTTKGPGEGTGLGLAVVHGIITRHGGAIRAYSEPGMGATFHVFLPLVRMDTTLTEHRVSAPLPRGDERILFVDDERMLVDMGRQMLTRLGYRVSAYTDSREALAAFLENPDAFDLLVTDQTMPQITGLELISRLREARPNLPAVLCTGFSQSATPERAKKIGRCIFMMKPLTLQDLATAVRRAMALDHA